MPAIEVATARGTAGGVSKKIGWDCMLFSSIMQGGGTATILTAAAQVKYDTDQKILNLCNLQDTVL